MPGPVASALGDAVRLEGQMKLQARLGFAWAVVAALACTSVGARAATLTGDTITQTDPLGTHSVLVGAGVDLTEGLYNV